MNNSNKEFDNYFEVKWSDLRLEHINEHDRLRNDIFAKVIGTLIMRRKQKNLTQKELADLAGITQANLAKIETGDSMPKLDTFCKLFMALEMKMVLSTVDKDEQTTN